jgi:hypothetical protein
MIEIEREEFNSKLAEEMLPRAQACWNESTAFKGESCAYYGDRDFQIEPDTAAYQGLSDQGKLVVVTIRDDGNLKGYVIGFTYYSLHHRKILCGIGDSIYIEPDYRTHTWALAKRFEKEMEGLGVKILGWPVHFNGPVYDVLKAKGYVGDDIVMEKRINLCA